MTILITIAAVILFLVVLKIRNNYKINKAQIIIDKPFNFGEKMDWLAIKSKDKIAISKALNAKQIKPCNWAMAFKKSNSIFSRYAYITPSIGEWTLVLFVNWKAEEENIENKLTLLSSEFEEAQYFISYRNLDAYGWARAKKGIITRLYLDILGDEKITSINKGDMEKIEYEFQYYQEQLQYELTIDKTEYDNEIFIASEDDVLSMAEYWSVSPFDLESRKDVAKELGLLIS